MTKHRLTKAQRRLIRWYQNVNGPKVGAIRHKSCDNDMTPWHAPTTVLIREGYLKAGKPDKWGFRKLTLTPKGAQAADAIGPGVLA